MSVDVRYLVCGMLLGAAVQCAGFTRREQLRSALAWRSPAGVRTLLYTAGLGMAAAALLCWLAVVDVDLLAIGPLNGSVLAGGVLFGAAMGLCGATPFTFAAGAGGGRLLESLCGLAGCALGAWAAQWVPQRLADGLFPPVYGTLYRLTLKDPWLLGGSFGALACTGVVVCVLALAVRLPEAAPVHIAQEEPPQAAPNTADPDTSPDAGDDHAKEDEPD